VDLVLASLPAPEVASDLRAQLARRTAEHERRDARPLRGLALRGPAFARLRLGRRVAALAALAAAVVLVVFATLRGGETPAPDAPQIAGPEPQDRPARAPEPGAEQRGEPLLAGQPSLEPAPDLEGLAEEELAMLLVLDAVEDLDVIANLELLEDLLELEGLEGAG
jgi:hypothetical protein